jgi:hypothetical protein
VRGENDFLKRLLNDKKRFLRKNLCVFAVKNGAKIFAVLHGAFK